MGFLDFRPQNLGETAQKSQLDVKTLDLQLPLYIVEKTRVQCGESVP